MFEKNLKLSYLLDIYGDTLDEHTRSIMQAYYDDDLSLSEIADGEGISRQGVRHIIKKGEEQLSSLEEQLGLANHYERLENAVRILEEMKTEIKAGKYDTEELVSSLDRVEDMIINK